MREIKFRAWDKFYEKMTDNFESWFIHHETFSIDCGIPIGNDIDAGRKINEFVIMQYTGLKDKNGVEIYEGDIVKHGESIRFIEFRGSNVCATRMNKKETILLSFCEKPKVIGNIYENKDLL